MLKHCMLDLEAIGRSPDGGVIAIGAVAFDPDPDDGEIGASFLRLIDPIDAARHGSVNMATMLWWMKQDATVRDEMFSGTLPLKKALRMFADWYKDLGFERVWANGTTFDITIMEHALMACNVKRPWHYRDVRDMRLFRDIVPREEYEDLYNKDGEGAHNALHDAVIQAQVVRRCLEYLGTAGRYGESGP